jgi:hypothetical protein
MMSDRATLVPEQVLHRNDGKEWSASDIEDLALALKDGGSIEGAAFFLCRAGTVDDVRQKAKELGLIGPAKSRGATMSRVAE